MESTPIKLTKLTTNEIGTVRVDDKNRNISSFPPAKKAREFIYPSGNIRQQLEEKRFEETADEIAEQGSLKIHLALTRKIHQ